MENKKELPLVKIAPILCIIAFAFVLAVVIYCGVTGEHESTRFSSRADVTPLTAYSDPWGSNPVADNYNGVIGKTESVFVMIPEDVNDEQAMMFKSSYCKCEVYNNENGTLLGSYAEKPPHSFGHMTGNIRVVVPLTEQLAGKTLRIDISTYYEATIDYPHVLYGTQGNLQLKVIGENALRLIICLVLITLMLLAICVGIFEYTTGAVEITKMFIDFIAFVLCILVWMICSSDIPQFYFNNNENISLISFLSLAMLSIPFSAFCSKALTKGSRIFAVSARAGWLLPVTICVCYITNICDPYHILILTHLYIAITLILAIICSLKQCKEDRGAKILAASLFAMSGFALLGFIHFYASKTSGYDAIFFGGGLALFIMMLFALMLHRQMGYYEKKKEAEMYKYMAYTDFLTGIPNRSAYEDRIFELSQQNTGRYIAFFVFDLNNLKKYNDMYGHQEGDNAIKATAECIKAAFSGRGDFFRLGGDEFAAIVLDNENYVGICAADFRRQIEIANTKTEHEIRVAVGWAEDHQNDDPLFYRKLFSRADADMYSEKQRMKEMEAQV